MIGGCVGAGFKDGNEKVMAGTGFGAFAMMWPCRITRLPVRWATVGPRSSHKNTSGHASVPLMKPMSTAAAAVVQRGIVVNHLRCLRAPIVAASMLSMRSSTGDTPTLASMASASAAGESIFSRDTRSSASMRSCSSSSLSVSGSAASAFHSSLESTPSNALSMISSSFMPGFAGAGIRCTCAVADALS